MSRKRTWARQGPSNAQTAELDAPAEMEEPNPESAADLVALETRTRDELMDVAKELGLSGLGSIRKQELVFRILQPALGPPQEQRQLPGRVLRNPGRCLADKSGLRA